MYVPLVLVKNFMKLDIALKSSDNGDYCSGKI